MNQLSSIVAVEIVGYSSAARCTRISASDGQFFIITDWHEQTDSTIILPRCVDVEARMNDAETLHKQFIGTDARKEAMQWIETQLPF